jgi:hypothetical protein
LLLDGWQKLKLGTGGLKPQCKMSGSIIYGFLVTYEKALKMFPKFELEDGEKGFKVLQRMIRESTILTKEICLKEPDFEFSTSDGSLKDEFTVMVGVCLRKVEFIYSAPMRIPSVSEDTKILLDQFVQANPAYAGIERELLVFVESDK